MGGEHPMGPSPWSPGRFEAASVNSHSFHGCSTHGCLAAPQGTAHLGLNSALIHPQWALGGDRDTGTGSVKIKPLFDWLDPRLSVFNSCWDQSRGWECVPTWPQWSVWWQGPLRDSRVMAPSLHPKRGAGIKRGQDW